MQKNLLTLAFIAIIGLQLQAQYISVSGTEYIQTNKTSCFYPQFSPAGDYLLVSEANYSGLRAYNFASRTLVALTYDAGAGFNAKISADGKSILYSKTDFIKNLRHNSLIQIDKATRVKKQLSSPSRNAVLGHFAANQPQYVSAQKLNRLTAVKADTKPIISIEDQQMVIYTTSLRKIFTPNGKDASYIWPSISPDMKNIVYTVAGKGTYVCKVDGSTPTFIGKINAPIWLNNSWIIGMEDKDDGEKLISSTLIAATIDGKIKQTVLTPTGVMAMYPAASADGKRIAFNTEKGEIYILNISIK